MTEQSTAFHENRCKMTEHSSTEHKTFQNAQKNCKKRALTQGIVVSFCQPLLEFPAETVLKSFSEKEY